LNRSVGSPFHFIDTQDQAFGQRKLLMCAASRG
jgi:hypothetical protein